MESGIYQWRSIKDNKIYIGQTERTFKERENEHLSMLRNNHHFNPHFQSAWNKYGEENFVFEILLIIEGKLNEIESQMIKAISPEYRYNMSTEGQAFMKGRKHTEETKIRISEAVKNRPPATIATRTRISESKKGINHPMFGKKATNKTKQRMSESRKGEKNWAYGKEFTVAHCEMLSKAKIGINRKPFTLEHTTRMSKSLQGKNSILTEIKVREIKFKHLSEGKLLQREIGEIYGVDRKTIGDIKQGKTWKHII